MGDELNTYYLELQKLRSFLNSKIIGREEMINVALTSLLSGEPLLLIGKTGTAKTYLVDLLASAIGGQYFYYLLSKFTEKDELLGVIAIEEYKKGKIEYIGRSILHANIVMLDEIYKATSSIVNMLLDIILNKRFQDKLLNILAFFFASNEYYTDEDYVAFNDRMTLKYFVTSYLSDPNLLYKLLKAELTHVEKPKLSVKDVQLIQHKYVREIYANTVGNTKLMNNYIDLVNTIRTVKPISDRKLKKIIMVASAIALLEGKTEASESQILKALIYTVPESPEEIRLVEAKAEEKKFGVKEEIIKLEMLDKTLRAALEKYKVTEDSKKQEVLQEIYSIILEIKKLITSPDQTIKDKAQELLKQIANEVPQVLLGI